MVLKSYSIDKGTVYDDGHTNPITAKAIVLGSSARNECEDPHKAELIKIDPNTMCIYDLDSSLNIIHSEGLPIQRITNPEMVLEAWTESSEEIEILSKAQNYLIHSAHKQTIRNIKYSIRNAANAIECGSYTLNGICHKQFERVGDTTRFFISSDQFGPKYNYLRFAQNVSLLAIIKNELTYPNTFFNREYPIRPTIQNRLLYLDNWNLLPRDSGYKEISRTYYKLSNYYQSSQRNNCAFFNLNSAELDKLHRFFHDLYKSLKV